jgi:hypothetical protein
VEEGTLLILRAIVRIGPGFLYSFLHFWGISQKTEYLECVLHHFIFQNALLLGEKRRIRIIIIIIIMQEFTIMTCQKFCGVCGGNLTKHIFSSKSRCYAEATLQSIFFHPKAGVCGGNLTKPIFFIQKQRGHFVFHNGPLLFRLGFSTEFLAGLLRQVKPLVGQSKGRNYRNWACTWLYDLVCALIFGNAIHLGLYPTHKKPTGRGLGLYLAQKDP